MSIKLKKVQDQVIVITGASSGIGLATAEMAVERGARVVLAARSEEELRDTCERLNRGGKRTIHVAADVADERQVERIAARAIAEFGGFDTWVNNAGISIYGKLLDVPIAEKRRLFDTNFWGVVYGCKAAVAHLRGKGGCIINMGSEASEFAIPLQGIYSASKHAVKGYTDALRMELEHDGVPVWVSLVRPGPIDTPFPEHARKHIAEQAKYTPPVYPPEEVARTILRCAEKPIREIVVGGVPRVQIAMHTIAPRLTDLYLERTAIQGQRRLDEPANADDVRTVARCKRAGTPARAGEGLEHLHPRDGVRHGPGTSACRAGGARRRWSRRQPHPLNPPGTGRATEGGWGRWGVRQVGRIGHHRPPRPARRRNDYFSLIELTTRWKVG